MSIPTNSHFNTIVAAGIPMEQAKKVLIMLHGRGADADDILSLADNFIVKDFALLAPSATNNSWYPQSFLSVPKINEPWLTAALDLLKEIVKEINEKGIASENIYFLGFSQGACLTLEFVARNAKRYGGVVAFTGGLIGDKIYNENYSGDFEGTPIFIGSSDPDMHVPVERVNASSSLLTKMNANVTQKLYLNMGHTINQDEISIANQFVFHAKK